MEKIDFALNTDFEQILTNPILDIAARFWDSERYQAFRVCYRSMRQIDDLIDDRKATGQEITNEEAEHLINLMKSWLGSVKNSDNLDQFQKDFLITIEKYKIPLWPWERLVKAMAFDATHDGYLSFTQFLRYTEGAAIAPASVFMHLSGIKKNDKEYDLPKYDIRYASRNLAIFSYLVHIIRDFQKDSKANLVYFPKRMLENFNLSKEQLFEIAETEKPSESFRELIREYRRITLFYREKAKNTVEEISPLLETRYKLSLEIIYALYNQIFLRIDPENGSFTTSEMNPEPSEVKSELELTASRFDFVLP